MAELWKDGDESVAVSKKDGDVAVRATTIASPGPVSRLVSTTNGLLSVKQGPFPSLGLLMFFVQYSMRYSYFSDLLCFLVLSEPLATFFQSL